MKRKKAIMENEVQKNLNENITPFWEYYMPHAREVSERRNVEKELIIKFVDRYNKQFIPIKFQFKEIKDCYVWSYKNNLKIYQVFINNKKCFTSTNQHEVHKWLMDRQELWLNPNEKHKIFGLIHNAQNNKFENMHIDTIVLDEYDNVLQNDKE